MRALLTLFLLGHLFCPLRAEALTIVVDFKDPGSTQSSDLAGGIVETFDIAAYGFLEAERPTLYNSILTELRRDFYDIPTMGVNPASVIPDGQQLDIDFVIGDIGSAPSNGDSEYYYVQVGDAVSAPSPNTLGQALGPVVRDSNGNHPFFVANATVLASVFTDNINGLCCLTPSGILSSGDLTASTHAVNGTLAHEIGHLVSLEHMDVAGSITPNGLDPLMGTGAIDLLPQQRLVDREFSFSGFNSEDGGAMLTPISQLVGALGTRAAPAAAVPEPATFALAATGLFGVLLLGRRRRR